MAARRTQADRLAELEERLEELEERLGAAGGSDYTPPAEAQDALVCAQPPTPPRTFDADVSVDRASAILAIGRKWANHTNLHYYMFDSGPFGGAADQQAVVRQGFDVWKNVGIGLVFTEVQEIDQAEIRIGFARNQGSWSTVGTDALLPGQSERTMNFGWNINVPGPNGLDTAVHEIGHALGLNHEHQNPNAGIVWNDQAVYDYFRRTQSPPWDEAKTDFNILDKQNPSEVDGSDWDPNSIMHYSFGPGLIREPAQFRNGLRPAAGLSEKDKEVIQRFYPPKSIAVLPELKPFRSQQVTLEPGDQVDFNVIPQSTRTYTFSTFGESDTVMVLFEDIDGDFVYVNGDDDSGFSRNARFEARLIKGRRYQLRIRLYYKFASGDTAVMMW